MHAIHASDPAEVEDLPERDLIYRRPQGFWAAFNEWWRTEFDKQGRRPDAKAIERWWLDNAAAVWPDSAIRPDLQDTRTHAKCLRPRESVRRYFQMYRQLHKDKTRTLQARAVYVLPLKRRSSSNVPNGVTSATIRSARASSDEVLATHGLQHSASHSAVATQSRSSAFVRQLSMPILTTPSPATPASAEPPPPAMHLQLHSHSWGGSGAGLPHGLPIQPLQLSDADTMAHLASTLGAQDQALRAAIQTELASSEEGQVDAIFTVQQRTDAAFVAYALTAARMGLTWDQPGPMHVLAPVMQARARVWARQHGQRTPETVPHAVMMDMLGNALNKVRLVVDATPGPADGMAHTAQLTPTWLSNPVQPSLQQGAPQTLNLASHPPSHRLVTTAVVPAGGMVAYGGQQAAMQPPSWGMDDGQAPSPCPATCFALPPHMVRHEGGYAAGRILPSILDWDSDTEDQQAGVQSNAAAYMSAAARTAPSGAQGWAVPSRASDGDAALERPDAWRDNHGRPMLLSSISMSQYMIPDTSSPGPSFRNI